MAVPWSRDVVRLEREQPPPACPLCAGLWLEGLGGILTWMDLQKHCDEGRSSSSRESALCEGLWLRPGGSGGAGLAELFGRGRMQ